MGERKVFHASNGSRWEVRDGGMPEEGSKRPLPQPSQHPHNRGMDTEQYPSHRELNLSLEAVEARMDGRIARIEDSIKRISDDSAATRENILSLKKTIVVTAIGAVLTVLFGIAAFNATLLSNMTSSFDSGRDTERVASEAKAEISSSVAEVRQMVQELKQRQSIN